MRTKFVAATVGTATLIALSTMAAAVMGSSSEVELEEMLPLLAAPQSDVDRAPDGLDLASLGGVSEDSLRWAGSDETGNYWVGRARATKVCLVVQLVADPLMSGSTCAPIPDFYRTGLKIRTQTGDPATSAEAYVLPADIDISEVGVPQAAATADIASDRVNLVSGRPDDLKGLKHSESHRESGVTFQFFPISYKGE